MSASTQLAADLGVVIGRDYRVAQDHFIFVEHATTTHPVRSATIVALSACTVLKGTLTFDFDAGVEGGIATNADVVWEQKSAVMRSMVPYNSAQIMHLGAIDFNSLSPETMKSLTYGTGAIAGNNDPSNKLGVNDVFAVKTTGGNFAKVQVLRYGYDLTIRWITYKINSEHQGDAKTASKPAMFAFTS